MSEPYEDPKSMIVDPDQGLLFEAAWARLQARIAQFYQEDMKDKIDKQSCDAATLVLLIAHINYLTSMEPRAFRMHLAKRYKSQNPNPKETK